MTISCQHKSPSPGRYLHVNVTHDTINITGLTSILITSLFCTDKMTTVYHTLCVICDTLFVKCRRQLVKLSGRLDDRRIKLGKIQEGGGGCQGIANI